MHLLVIFRLGAHYINLLSLLKTELEFSNQLMRDFSYHSYKVKIESYGYKSFFNLN